MRQIDRDRMFLPDIAHIGAALHGDLGSMRRPLPTACACRLLPWSVKISSKAAKELASCVNQVRTKSWRKSANSIPKAEKWPGRPRNHHLGDTEFARHTRHERPAPP